MAELLLPEDSFNRILATLLQTTRPEWSADGVVLAETWRTFGQWRVKPDIFVNDPSSPPVIVECAYGGDRDTDAKNRLLKTPIETVVSVAIPHTFKTKSENEARQSIEAGACIQYAILQRELSADHIVYRFPQRGYLSGTYSDLASLIFLAALPKSRVENIAKQVADLIDECGQTLGNGLSELDWQELSDQVFQSSSLSAQRTVAVLWLDAMLVHSNLRSKGAEIARLPLKSDLVLSNLLESWKALLNLNWYSIFAPACTTLELSISSTRSSTFDAVCHLLDAVEIIETAKLGRHINIGADLFPKISEDREVAAAFYTTPPTSELLASLLVRKEDRTDWSSTMQSHPVKFVDFACGTGSLIRAVYRRINEYVTSEGGELNDFHTRAMESYLTATDISPIAAHLTNSSLAMIGDGSPYTSTNIGWLSVGHPFADGVGLSTGSLEFLQTSSLKDLFFDLSESLVGIDNRQDRTIDSDITAPDGTFDYVVMNPPYSRSTGGKHGAFQLAGLSTKEQELCRTRWGRLISREPADKNAGMAASFLVLAAKKVKPNGRIGFVLPLTVAFGDSWRKTRSMLVTHFKDIVVVANAAEIATTESLSSDTNMGEILVVATKRTTPTPPDHITYVSLRRPVARLYESREIARVIQASTTNHTSQGTRLWLSDEDMVGTSVSFLPQEPTEEWSPVGVLNPTLLGHIFHFIKTGELLNEHGHPVATLMCPVSTVAEVFEVGMSPSSIGCPRNSKSPRGAFTVEEIKRKADRVGPYRSLWSANKDTQKQFIVQPTHLGTPRESPKKVDLIMQTVSTFHYAQGLRLTSQALIVACTEKAVLGGRAWLSLRNKAPWELQSVFTLWANSSLGLIIHWMKGTRTQNGRSCTSINVIKSIPCPDFSFLSSAKFRQADVEFKRLKQLKLLPACQAHVDPTRQEIDRVVVKLLDLPKVKALDSIKMLRDWWCAEPSVHGSDRAALAKLNETKSR